MTGLQLLEERAKEEGIELGNQISGSVFSQLGLPMIVACTGCGMTMALSSCFIDEDSQVWCADCYDGDE